TRGGVCVSSPPMSAACRSSFSPWAGGCRSPFPAAPAAEGGGGLELREIGLQRPAEAARLGGRGVPEEDDLARGDLDDLDLVRAGRAGERGRGAAGAAQEQLVLAVGPHASAAAA